MRHVYLSELYGSDRVMYVRGIVGVRDGRVCDVSEPGVEAWFLMKCSGWLYWVVREEKGCFYVRMAEHLTCPTYDDDLSSKMELIGDVSKLRQLLREFSEGMDYE
jgi:hypothetical protein